MLKKNNAKVEQGVAMAGFIFTISILSILITVGFLFAWMVRLASTPELQDKQPSTPPSTGPAKPVSPAKH